MPASILNQGQTAIRDATKGLVTHVVITTDTTAFSAASAGINPGAGTTSTHAAAAVKADVGTDAADYTFTLDGGAFFTGKVINAIGVARGVGVRASAGTGGTHTVQPSGATTVGTDTLTRSVRNSGLGIGVQDGDLFTVGVRLTHQDNS